MPKKKIFISLILLLFVSSCGDSWESVKRGLTGQKQKTTDEFLVRKKDPLILPPNYDVLPTPKERKDAEEERSIFQTMVTDEENVSEESSNSGKSIEENILKKIKKN